MLQFVRSKLLEVLRAIAPLVGSVCVLQLALVQAPLPQFLQFLAGSVLAVIGMLMLFAGVEHGILPMGRYIGAELPHKGSVWLIVAVAASLGFATTIAEPDVLILSAQVQSIAGGQLPGYQLISLIAGGVALFAAVALWCIAHGYALTRPLAATFALIIVLSLLSAQQFVPLAYDAGSVTTGVLSAPVLMALGLGLSSVLSRHSGTSEGFGILGLASAGPVVVVLIVGLLR